MSRVSSTFDFAYGIMLSWKMRSGDNLPRLFLCRT